MTHSYIRRGALVAGAAMIAQLAVPAALAAPLGTSITADASALPHATIQVSGVGFSPGESVRIIFGLSQATTSASASGSFASAPVTVPAVSSGTYVILAVGETSGRVALTYVYVSSFMPAVTPSAWWAPPGTRVTFAGSGFAPGETVTATMTGSSTAFASFAADAHGAFSGQGGFTLPYALRNGSVRVTLAGATSGASIPLTIGIGDLYPWATPSAWYILPGNAVTMSGGGFAPGEGVSVRQAGSALLLAHATADAAGAFSATTTITIPYGSGAVTFVAQGDASGASANAPITRAAFYPTLSPSAYYAAPGATISLAGSGFVPNELVNITLGTASTSAMTDAKGNFSIAAVKLPGIGGVQIPVTAIGATSGATASFTMTMGQYYTWTTLSTYWASAGSPLTVTGHNFAAGEAVALSTKSGTFATTTADTMGNFAATTAVPYGPPGDIAIVATGAMSNAPATVGMTIAPVYTNIQLGKYAGAPGSTIEFIGSGYVPNDLIQITTDRTGASPVATFSASASGAFDNASYAIPAGWSQGNLLLTITGTKSYDTKKITYYVTGK